MTSINFLYFLIDLITLGGLLLFTEACMPWLLDLGKDGSWILIRLGIS